MTLKLRVNTFSAQDLAVNGGTPKPLAVKLQLEESLLLQFLPVDGTVIFRCQGLDPKVGSAEPEIAALPSILIYSIPRCWIDLVALGPFALAVASILWATVILFSNSHLGRFMAAPEWKLADSFLSTVTVGGGLVNGLTTLAFFSSTVLAEKDTYVLIGLLFAALVGLAPFVYSLTRKPNPKFDPASPGKNPQFLGAVWSFLAASLFTIWGNAGQVVLFWTILTEFWIAGKLPDSLFILLQLLNAAILVALAVFGTRAMIRTGESAQANVAEKQGQESVEAPTPKWTWL